MKVFVFGSNGMLGRYVSAYLKEAGHEVVDITRKDIDVSNVNAQQVSNFFARQHFYPGDIVVNCIGLIKQKMTDNDIVNAIKTNTVWPHLLSSCCRLSYRLIHISTDCVFSGDRGGYVETDVPDATDIYGITKAIGEPTWHSVIRTSIIGESDYHGSLLEWVRQQKNIFGYTNHLWSGVTCLQLAKLIDQIIQKRLFWEGIRHYVTKPITKAQLIKNMSEVYNLDVSITDIEANSAVDRSMGTLYDCFEAPPDILTQLIEQKYWIYNR